jgi:cell division protein FtsB
MKGKNVIWVLLGCLQLTILIFFGYRLFGEYSELEHRKSNKAELQHEKQYLSEKIVQTKDFLDRLAYDVEFQDNVVRRELGYGKANETIYRFPATKDATSLMP